MEKRNCERCGKEFETAHSHQKYCCADCRQKEKSRRALERYKTVAVKHENKKEESNLEDIVAEARKAGMSYGQYVAFRKM